MPHEVLVERAGLAAALAAVRLLPRVYGVPVTVLCGPGSNGADGRVAARHLAARGAAVTVLDVRGGPSRVEGASLVLDAAFGTGLARPWDPPTIDPSVRVLAVDLPSGVDPDTGVATGGALRAVRTVAMGAIKRGHLQADGAALSGDVTVAPLGIGVIDPSCGLVDDGDLDAISPLQRDEHKWRRAVVVVSGSPGMLGAPSLVCDGALAAQGGMVLLVAPDVPRAREGPWPREVVRLAASAADTDKVVAGALERAHALVLGPGLGRSPRLRGLVAAALAAARAPVVLDADALHLVDADQLRERQARGGGPLVLTPHDGEYAALFGAPPGSDRFGAAARAAQRTGCTVLLKGPTTVVASPAAARGAPALLAVTAGVPDLATPGAGDVLAGVIAALLARGLDAHLAAALGAHVHGRAGASLGATCRAGALPAAVASFLAGRAATRSGS